MTDIIARYEWAPIYYSDRLMLTHRLVEGSEFEHPRKAYIAYDDGEIVTDTVLIVCDSYNRRTLKIKNDFRDLPLFAGESEVPDA